MFFVVLCIVLFFFFSSRRRHTRLQGDWSSDVCSSDLTGRTSSLQPACRTSDSWPWMCWPMCQYSRVSSLLTLAATRSRAASIRRSEEHTSELQSPCNLVCRLLLEKKKKSHIIVIR